MFIIHIIDTSFLVRIVGVHVYIFHVFSSAEVVIIRGA